jgi:hypothetical protein
LRKTERRVRRAKGAVPQPAADDHLEGKIAHRNQNARGGKKDAALQKFSCLWAGWFFVCLDWAAHQAMNSPRKHLVPQAQTMLEAARGFDSKW